MASDNLRGTLVESLENEITGNINEDDVALVRFHGMYVQDDRDRRDERADKKLERLYSFMIRLRLTGGFITPEQWIALHNIAGENSTGVLKDHHPANHTIAWCFKVAGKANFKGL